LEATEKGLSAINMIKKANTKRLIKRSDFLFSFGFKYFIFKIIDPIAKKAVINNHEPLELAQVA